MLYVFQVDTGMMMTFDMRLVTDTVGNLKKAIAIKTDIPEDKQVLLISGGESLSNMQRICSYSSAGTDTSPIFLFAKINIESNQPPILNVDYGDDTDMTEMIESCMSMQPSLDTLVARTELAADLNDQAIKQKEICERLVHDQHLQQQGWAAVTANLEDLTRAFKNKAEILMTAFGEFTKCKQNHIDLLSKFNDDLKHLDCIPILSTLVDDNTTIKEATALAFSHSAINTQTTKNNTTMSQAADNQPGREGNIKQDEDVFLDANLDSVDKVTSLSVSAPVSPAKHSKLASLRQWIDYHDSHNSLERLVELCWRGLDRFTDANAEQIRHEVQELLKAVNNSSMKEIKGLEERLFGLEKLMVDAKKVVDEQSQLSSSFQNNRERFSKIKDSTLLPDLSASHKQQLQMMLSNHKKMSDYRERCIRAKNELSFNLHARLKWIMYIEQQISDLDGKLMIYKENLLRLNRHFDIVDQVHRSPDLYLAAVVETLRRRRFTEGYLEWANNIAKISTELYENEMKLRKNFDAKIGPHFLSNLFPALSRSYPPPFATTRPEPFDTKLPIVTTEDIQFLQTNLSEQLSSKLQIPEDIHLPEIRIKQSSKGENERREIDEFDNEPKAVETEQLKKIEKDDR